MEAEAKIKQARTDERLAKQKELEEQAIAAAKEAAGEPAAGENEESEETATDTETNPVEADDFIGHP